MITVYSKLTCPHCVIAMKILEDKGVSYQEVKIDQDDGARRFLMKQGHRSVPQIYRDEELLVENYRELNTMTKEEIEGTE